MFESLIKLAWESNRVIALRTMKLMAGGRSARRESRLMVNEKIVAGLNVATSLARGASGDQIVQQYRRRVAANAKRLGKIKLTGSRKRRRFK
jgi:hypothetical protein